MQTPAPLAGELPDLGLMRAPSLAEQAADAIVDHVASGALQPGQRLVESDLAASMNMSRVPLREALKILEVQGIVESEQHKGTRVARFDASRMRHGSEVRVALERLAFRDAAAVYLADQGRVAVLDRLIARMGRAAEQMEWLDISRIDLAFHREVVRASGNFIVRTLWESLSRHILIQFGYEIRDEQDAEVFVPQHRRLRELLAAGDAAALHSEVESHILRFQRKSG
ncbi:MAG: GntR family transcriptional regulator [Paracoccaceae bacterium]